MNQMFALINGALSLVDIFQSIKAFRSLAQLAKEGKLLEEAEKMAQEMERIKSTESNILKNEKLVNRLNRIPSEYRAKFKELYENIDKVSITVNSVDNARAFQKLIMQYADELNQMPKFHLQVKDQRFLYKSWINYLIN